MHKYTLRKLDNICKGQTKMPEVIISACAHTLEL